VKTKIYLRLLLAVVGVLLVAMVGVDYFASKVAESTYRDSLTRKLEDLARAIVAGYDPPRAAAMARSAGMRVTVITRDGSVLLDSEARPEQMENHRGRPEFAEALTGRRGSNVRKSATTGVPYLYVAIPMSGGALRLAVPLHEVDEQVNQIRWRMLGVTVLAFLPAIGIAGVIALRIARQLNAAGADLQRAVEQLEKEHAELERVERVRKDFVINVSHELRTPLASIQGYAETLMDGALEDQANNRRFLGIIRQNAERLANLTADLLTLSRIEMRQQDLHFGMERAGEMITGALDTVRPIAAKKGIVLELASASGPDEVYCDREAVHQILINLLDNAIKYTPAGGRITAGVRNFPGDAALPEFYVRDTGQGIPAGDLPRLFERFYRVDKARSREMGGTGLGLAIVKHLARAQGGDVYVESRLNEGSTFSFTLSSTIHGAVTVS
jgi:two-component system phosphate regulon sensor histidine kinase PhoR